MMMSLTIESTILLKARPMMTAIASSKALPLSANSLNSLHMSSLRRLCPAEIRQCPDSPVAQIAYLVLHHLRKIRSQYELNGQGLRHACGHFLKPRQPLLGRIDLIQDLETGGGEKTAHIGGRRQITDRRIARPRHGKYYRSPLALKNIVDGEYSVFFQHPPRMTIDEILALDVHGDMDRHGGVEAMIGKREVGRIGLEEGSPAIKAHPLRQLRCRVTKARRQIDPGDMAAAGFRQGPGGSAEPAADVEHPRVLIKIHAGGEFQSRLAAAYVKLIDRGKIGSLQLPQVLSGGEERIGDVLDEGARTRVVGFDLASHGDRSPARNMQASRKHYKERKATTKVPRQNEGRSLLDSVPRATVAYRSVDRARLQFVGLALVDLQIPLFLVVPLLLGDQVRYDGDHLCNDLLLALAFLDEGGDRRQGSFGVSN